MIWNIFDYIVLHHLAREVEDRVFVWFHRLRRVDDKHKGRVEHLAKKRMLILHWKTQGWYIMSIQNRLWDSSTWFYCNLVISALSQAGVRRFWAELASTRGETPANIIILLLIFILIIFFFHPLILIATSHQVGRRSPGLQHLGCTHSRERGGAHIGSPDHRHQGEDERFFSLSPTKQVLSFDLVSQLWPDFTRFTIFDHFSELSSLVKNRM